MKHQTKEMTERIRRQLSLLTVILTLCSTTVLAACGSSDDPTGQDGKGKVAEIVSRGTSAASTRSTGWSMPTDESPGANRRFSNVIYGFESVKGQKIGAKILCIKIIIVILQT